MEDFTGRDPERPTSFARVYFQASHPDPAQRWHWTVAGTHQIGMGHEATVREAAREAEEVYIAWRDKQ